MTSHEPTTMAVDKKKDNSHCHQTKTYLISAPLLSYNLRIIDERNQDKPAIKQSHLKCLRDSKLECSMYTSKRHGRFRYIANKFVLHTASYNIIQSRTSQNIGFYYAAAACRCNVTI
jgi:hypothetical protein